jgi:hypothetical protein
MNRRDTSKATRLALGIITLHPCRSTVAIPSAATVCQRHPARCILVDVEGDIGSVAIVDCALYHQLAVGCACCTEYRQEEERDEVGQVQ